MHKMLIVLLLGAGLLTGCSKKSGTASSGPSDAVQQKLQELAGSDAKDCGRLKSQAAEQTKPAADCAMQAAQNKQPFYVAYDLPGLTIGVAGNAQGNLYTVDQSGTEAGGTPSAVKSEPCPAELRVAQSGRVTCFSMGSMPGMGTNPHSGVGATSGMENPHEGLTTSPSGMANPHGGEMVTSHGSKTTKPESTPKKP